MKRAIERSKLDRETNIELVETMWEQFSNLGIYESNVIDTTTHSVKDTVSAVKEKIVRGTALLLRQFQFVEQTRRENMELSIQERLKDLRVERGLTLEQLAEQTHLSKSALGSYEADEYKDISHYALIELTKFL